MRIVLWHGYLLGGTGSNVYTRALAREWSRAGHDVTVFCQEPRPGASSTSAARDIVRPEIGGLLPVFVLDRYEGLEARLLQDLTRGERERYVELNAAALRAQLPADLVFANHVLLGGPVAAASGARYAVKAHGSELEYSMRGNAELAALGARGARAAPRPSSSARRTSAGCSRRSSATSTACTRCRPASTSTSSGPQPRAEALAGLLEEARRDPPNPGNANERLPDEGNADRLAAFLARRRADRPLLRQAALQQGRPPAARGAARARRARRDRRLRRLPRASSRRSAPPRTLFTGPLEHRHLVHLLPLADVAVVPSIFPEAFGMVAAEAAAAGCPPLVARHSGLAEIAEGLEAEYPPSTGDLTSFADGRRRRPRARSCARCSRSRRDERAALGAAARARGRRAPLELARASPTGCFKPLQLM